MTNEEEIPNNNDQDPNRKRKNNQFSTGFEEFDVDDWLTLSLSSPRRTAPANQPRSPLPRLMSLFLMPLSPPQPPQSISEQTLISEDLTLVPLELSLSHTLYAPPYGTESPAMFYQQEVGPPPPPQPPHSISEETLISQDLTLVSLELSLSHTVYAPPYGTESSTESPAMFFPQEVCPPPPSQPPQSISEQTLISQDQTLVSLELSLSHTLYAPSYGTESSTESPFFQQEVGPPPPPQPPQSISEQTLISQAHSLVPLELSHSHTPYVPPYGTGSSTESQAQEVGPPRCTRRNPTQVLREGKSATVTPPFRWATNHRATVHSLEYLLSEKIYTITGDVQCRQCERQYEMGFDLKDKFYDVGYFIEQNRITMYDRAPGVWTNPVLPRCRFCDHENRVRPIISEKKKEINWLFLLLGQMLGCCTLEQLKYFCKHTNNHRTGAKDRVLYLTYLGLCKQLDSTGPFNV